MLAQPRFKFSESQPSTLIQVDKKCKCFAIVEFQAMSVDTQKCRRHGHGDSLVSIDEWILRDAFPESGSLLNDVRVVTALRSGNRRFKSTTFPDAERTSKLGYEQGVDRDYLVHGRIEGHSARRRSNSGC